ncbi:hypothetical protein J4205_00775 [Candidatus Pacearchaeota archaeon]|nr:hypothetical protein [Candidatus Pacearchaeota archaeon]
MEIRSIKNVDEETWREFKAIAAKNNVKMSSLLKIMIKEFEKNSKDFWNEILNGEKLMSDKEAEEMKILTIKLRKEKGFRE